MAIRNGLAPALTPSGIQIFGANPDLAPDGNLPIQTPAGGAATITGTLSATEATDTLSATAVRGHPGTLGATDGADTMSATAVRGHPGTLAATDPTDALAASGDVSTPAATITGTLSAIEAADTFEASGQVGDVVFGGGEDWYPVPRRRAARRVVVTMSAQEAPDEVRMVGVVDRYAAARAEDEFWLLAA